MENKNENGKMSTGFVSDIPRELRLSAYEKKLIKQMFGEIRCPVCGKRFIPAVQHVYKQYKTGKKVCSWSCVVKSERQVLGNDPEKLKLRGIHPECEEINELPTKRATAQKSKVRKAPTRKPRYRPQSADLRAE